MSARNTTSITPTNLTNKRILVAALDWGMGHTTRLVSLLKLLQNQENQLIFAGNSNQCQFIKAEFPEIELADLSGYEIRLDSKKSTYWQLFRQRVKFKKAIKAENEWLAKFVTFNKVDLIISDNRYGCYHPKIKSILLTHQLNLQIPYFRQLVNKMLRRRIEKFDVCWVPDTKYRLLSGELSNAKLKIPIVYIGILNRFQKLQLPIEFEYLVILSGPEPEKTNFKEEILKQLSVKPSSVCIVGAEVTGYHCHPNPTTTELAELIAKSHTVISRAGYTTLMEMVDLNKKAILIPTKGQYEQMYLANFVQHPRIEFRRMNSDKS
jgi:UDP-N-acetylglucosamine:LPS N-acetylglucosamine transferase